MLARTWTEIEYRLDVFRATQGAHIEVSQIRNFIPEGTKCSKTHHSIFSDLVDVRFCNTNDNLGISYIYVKREQLKRKLN
jgi:hypothetical protein